MFTHSSLRFIRVEYYFETYSQIYGEHSGSVEVKIVTVLVVGGRPSWDRSAVVLTLVL